MTCNIFDLVYALCTHGPNAPGSISCGSCDTRVTYNQYEYPCPSNDVPSHAMFALNNRVAETFRYLYSTFVHRIALIPSRHGNAIGVATTVSIFRQYPFGAFAVARCFRILRVRDALTRSAFLSVNPLLDKLDLSIERPSISIGIFSTSVTDVRSPARDKQRAQQHRDALSLSLSLSRFFVYPRDLNSWSVLKVWPMRDTRYGIPRKRKRSSRGL